MKFYLPILIILTLVKVDASRDINKKLNQITAFKLHNFQPNNLAQQSASKTLAQTVSDYLEDQLLKERYSEENSKFLSQTNENITIKANITYEALPNSIVEEINIPDTQELETSDLKESSSISQNSIREKVNDSLIKAANKET